MFWYQIINAKSDSYDADRDAEDLLRQFSMALHAADVPVEAKVFYGRTSTGARLFYFSLSPEALEVVETVLTSYEATALAKSPDLTGMAPIRSL